MEGHKALTSSRGSWRKSHTRTGAREQSAWPSKGLVVSSRHAACVLLGVAGIMSVSCGTYDPDPAKTPTSIGN
jgi:hypothetical protein